MTVDLTDIINAAIALIMAILSTFVIPWLKGKIKTQDMESFNAWVKIAVAAAEQIYTSVDGYKKKVYVLQYLNDKGYDVDMEDVENAVEAAVLELHHQLYGTEVSKNG